MSLQVLLIPLAIIFCCVLGYIIFSLVGEEKSEDLKITKKRLQKIKNKEYDVPEQDVEAQGRNLIHAILSDEEYKYAFIGRILGRFNLINNLKHVLKLAGIKADVSVFLFMVTVLFIVAFIFFYIFPGTRNLSIILGLITSILLPFIFLKMKRGKRLNTFTSQLPDALGLVSSSLRAGHSLSSAFAIVVNELPEPICSLFRMTCEDINLGRSTKEALENMIVNMPDSLDLRFFVTAVLIQREIGGNLAEILDNLNDTIRERFKLLGQLKAQTAQARLSGIVLALAPGFIAGIIYLLNPSYMTPLFTHPFGKFAIGTAVFFAVVGFLIIRKITNIRV